MERLLVTAPTRGLRNRVKVSGALGVRVEPSRRGPRLEGSEGRGRCAPGVAAKAQGSALSGRPGGLPSGMAG